MTKLLLFIPFFNCEKQLPRVLNSLLGHQDLFSQILLVDNQSTDQSLEVSKKWLHVNHLKNAIVIRNHLNVNLGGSHKIAFHYAKENNCSHLLVLHGDDQASIQDIVPFISNKDFLDVDCLLGSRFSKSSHLIGYSLFRTIGNHALNILCSLACRKKVEDMGSGLNLYRCDVLENEYIFRFPNDLTFNVYLLFHSCFSGHKVEFFPISWREEDQVSNAKVFKQMTSILKIIFFTFVNQNALYKNAQSEKTGYDIVHP